jgi:cytochrome c oxidase subunit 2
MNPSGGMQSAFDPQSPAAAAIAELAWVMFAGAALVFVLVMALAAIAVFRRPTWLGRHSVVIAGGIAFPTGVVLALLLYSLRIAAAGQGEPSGLRIEVIGHQWWWQIRYLDARGSVDFETANEIRLPVGQPVQLEVASADVLHSFWVPSLAGKLDMIPGKNNRLRLRAGASGVVRGQCAEYCGGPHAQMAFFVVAQAPAEFEAWREAQRRPAQTPGNELTTKGRDVFLAHCAACHTVRGTAAAGELGPDLTHVGSRVSIGAGILPNNTGAIGGWIASSQHIKPGNLMPSFQRFSGGELQALAAYVESLK